MNKKEISTALAPAPIGAYSQAVRSTGSVVFLSGQIGIEPQTGLLREGFAAQLEQIFANIEAVARAGGGSMQDVVKLTVFLLEMSAFPLVNAAMEKIFIKPYPARSTVQVSALPRGALVEIEAIVVV